MKGKGFFKKSLRVDSNGPKVQCYEGVSLKPILPMLDDSDENKFVLHVDQMD